MGSFNSSVANQPEVLEDARSIFEEGLIAPKVYPVQFIFHLAIFWTGVPLNAFTGLVIVSNSQLYNARNAIWIAVILSNFFVYSHILLEYFIYYQHSLVACRILAVIMGKPYLILLINLFLATCDRLVYTKWPLFHKRHVTVARVIAIQLLCSSSVFVIFTVPFWALDMPIRCGIEPVIIKTSLAAMVTFTLLCIVLKVVVYILVTKSDGEAHEGIVTREIPLLQLPVAVNRCSPGTAKRSQSAANKIKSLDVSRLRLRVHCGSRRIRQMERNATMTLVAGLGPLCLFTLLSYLYMLAQALCRVTFEDCEAFNSIEIYFRELIFLHVSTDLLFYIFRSPEFKSAARQVLCGRFRRRGNVRR